MYVYLICAIAVLMLGFGVGPWIWNSVRDQRIRSDGMPARATVLSIVDTRSRVNGDPVVDVSLSVDVGDGRPYPVRLSTAMSPVDLPRFQAGMTVDVVVDRRDGSRVVIGRKSN